MTTVTRITRTPGYELCRVVQPADMVTINVLVDGHSRQLEWPKIVVELVQVEHGDIAEPSASSGTVLLRADVPWLVSHALVFRAEAVARLGLPLSSYGEFLPLQCRQAELVLYNPLNVIDCLDEAASVMTRTKSGVVAQIRKYVFREQDVPRDGIFKIPSIRSSPVFVSGGLIDEFRAAAPVGIALSDV